MDHVIDSRRPTAPHVLKPAGAAHYVQVDVRGDLDLTRLANAIAVASQDAETPGGPRRGARVRVSSREEMTRSERLARWIREDAEASQRESKWLVSIAPVDVRRHRIIATIADADRRTAERFVQRMALSYAQSEDAPLAVRSDGVRLDGERVELEARPRADVDADTAADANAHAYWQDQRWRELVPRTLPIERRVAQRPKFVSGRVSLSFDRVVAIAAHDAAARAGASPAASVLAAWQLLLWHLLDRSPFVTGVVLDERPFASIASAARAWGQPLPLTCEPDADLRVGELVAGVQRQVDALRIACDAFVWPAGFSPSGREAFPVLFEARAPQPSIRAGGATWRIVELSDCRDDYRLRCCCEIGQDVLRATIYYHADLIDRQDAVALCRQFGRLVGGLACNFTHTVAEAGVLASRVRASVAAGADATHRPVSAMFDAQARATPDRPAVVAPDGTRTYGELLADAIAVADRLRALGVTPDRNPVDGGAGDAIVGLIVEPSVWTMSALWGVLLAGAAYAPLDSETPSAYRERQLTASRIGFVLARRSTAASVTAAGVRTLVIEDVVQAARDRADRGRVDRSPPTPVRPEHLAYVIHTSGSTGTPKAVGVPHGALANYTDAICRTFELFETRRPLSYVLAYSLAADLGNTCLFPALTSGGCLHIVPKVTAIDGASFADYMTRHAIDVFKAVPSHLRALLAHGGRVLPRTWLISGGEPFHAELFDRIQAAGATCKVANHYGPTETTVGCLTERVQRSEDVLLPAIVPAGRPLPETDAYVLDRAMRPVGLNIPGELYVGGAGVARGYLHDPRQTAERFVPHPFSSTPGRRLYRTGDVARRRRGGRIQVVGRRDDQVKIRGYRIELTELEAVLAQHPAVAAAAFLVVREPSGAARLAAYLTRRDGPPVSDEVLQTFMRTQLPPAMIPSDVIWLDRMPLKSNGKADKQQLAAMTKSAVVTVSAPDADASPTSELETRIVEIWKKVLLRDSVGTRENFFELGGDSILAIQLAADLRAAGMTITPIELFRHPTVAQLAAIIGAAPHVVAVDTAIAESSGTTSDTRTTAAAGVNASPSDDRSGPYPLTPLQQGMLFHCLSAPGERLYVSEVRATYAAGFDPEAYVRAWARIVERHSIFRTAFRWDDRGEPVQIALPRVTLPVERLDWSQSSPDDLDARLDRYCDVAHDTEIALDVAPLMRLVLIALPDGRHHVVWHYHHLIMDGWSHTILRDEIDAYYDAFRQARDTARSVPAPYRDYVEWLQRQDAASAEAFWRRCLRGFRAATAVPGATADADAVSGPSVCELIEETIPAEQSDALRALSRREQLTLSSVVQGAWALVLAEHSGDADVLFGVTMVVRPPEVPALAGTIGLFLNTLPMRVRVPADAWVLPWLRQLQDDQAEAREHGHSPLVQVQAWSDVPRGVSIFDTFIGFHNPALVRRDASSTVTPLRAERRSFRGGWTNYPMSVDIESYTDEIVLGLNVDTRRLTPAGARQVLASLRSALFLIATQPTSTLGSLLRVLARERREHLTRQPRAFARRQREPVRPPQSS